MSSRYERIGSESEPLMGSEADQTVAETVRSNYEELGWIALYRAVPARLKRTFRTGEPIRLHTVYGSATVRVGEHSEEVAEGELLFLPTRRSFTVQAGDTGWAAIEARNPQAGLYESTD